MTPMQPGPENVQTQPPDLAIEVQDEQAGEKRKSVRLGSVHGEVHSPKFRNELKRLTSLRKVITSTQFWESLPLLSKVFLVLSVVDTALVIAFAVWQMTEIGGELLHISLAMLVAALFFLLFVWDAIVYENAFELVASSILAVVVAVRVLYFVIVQHHRTDVAIAVLAMVLQAVTVVLGYFTWSQFGWRTYSKLACDMRIKNAQQLRVTYILMNCYQTLLKLDFQFVMILTIIGIDVAVQVGPGEKINAPLIVTNSVGFPLMAGWGILSYIAVKHEHKGAWTLLAISLPLCLLVPVVNIVLVFATHQDSAANAQESLLLSAILVIVTRALVWTFMHILHRRFEKAKHEQQKNARQLRSIDSTASLAGMAEKPLAGRHAELQPLMRGAWIGKPSVKTPRKRRYFQLSQDGSTLRWSWNKYILLYYVEELEVNDDDLVITLKMALEADLRLKFYEPSTFSVWRRGLEKVMSLIFAPGGLDVSMDAAHLIAPYRGEGTSPYSAEQRDMVLQLVSESTGGKSSPHELLRKLGIKHSRRSLRDPENLKFQQVAQRARSRLLTTPENSVTPSTGGMLELAPSGTPTGSMHSASPEAGSLPEGPALLRGHTVPVAALLDALREENQTQDAAVGAAESQAEGATPGLAKTRSVPARFKRRLADCLSPGGTFRVSKHHKLVESQRPARSPAPSPERISTDGALVEPRLQRGHAVFPGAPPVSASFLAEEAQSLEGHLPPGLPLAPVDEHREVLHPPLGMQPGAGQSSMQVDQQQQQPGLSQASDSADSQPQSTLAQGALQPLQSHISSVPSVPTSPFEVMLKQEAQGDANMQDAAAQHFNEPSIPQQTQEPSPMSEDSTATTQAFPPGGAGAGFLGAGTAGSGMASSGTGSSTAATSPHEVARLLKRPKVSIDIIKYEDLVWGRFLGRGAEGPVHACLYLDTPVAVKQTSSSTELEMNLSTGTHDNVVALRGLCQHQSELYLVMEYCPRGTLDTLLHHSARRFWNPRKLVALLIAVVRGMVHLHAQRPPLLHRDLKPGNIFLGHGLQAKIGDFGMSRLISLKQSSTQKRPTLERSLTAGVIGTAAYAAPELLLVESPRQEPDSLATILKSDVWAFGITLWEVLERKRPFGGMDGFQIQTQWYMGESPKLAPVSIPDNLDAAGKTIMRSLAQMVLDCTQHEPELRPSFRDIMAQLKLMTPNSDAGSSDT